jgi:tryptophanyl-tRNA synthetase
MKNKTTVKDDSGSSKAPAKEILLTGDRPTGQLHLGHYAGTLKKRVELQDDVRYKQFVFISDIQALTDNARDPDKIRQNLIEVALDYLSVGLDPKKTVLFVQSQIPELAELTMYYMNLVTLGRLQRNPTVKSEMKDKGFGSNVPAGFLSYPVSQAADITAFKAKYVPGGEDQEPIIEQTREIVRAFNAIYGDILVEPYLILPGNDVCNRLPGTDGKGKMSKSLGNAIYLADPANVVKEKIMNMYTDPNHLKVGDPGAVEGNIPFIYLRAFAKPEHLNKYLPEYKSLDEIEAHYRRGGLGDMKVKRLLNEIIQEELAPIRERRKYYENNIGLVLQILQDGCKEARAIASDTLQQVRQAIGIEYFQDETLKKMYIEKYK